MTNQPTLSERIEAARIAGDWDEHARLWEERRVAAVDADERSIKATTTDEHHEAAISAGWKRLSDGTYSKGRGRNYRRASSAVEAIAADRRAGMKFHNPCEFSACMAMDAFRLCLGQKPRNFTASDVAHWLVLLGKSVAA